MPSQRSLNCAQRLRRVRSAFVPNPARLPVLQGRCVLLIDDVMTATEALLRADAMYMSAPPYWPAHAAALRACSQSAQKPDRAPNASDLQATVTS